MDCADDCAGRGGGRGGDARGRRRPGDAFRHRLVGALTFAVVTPPAHGKLSGAGASVVYSPDADWSGADSFAYTASDGARRRRRTRPHEPADCAQRPRDDARAAAPAGHPAARAAAHARVRRGADRRRRRVHASRHGLVSAAVPDAADQPELLALVAESQRRSAAGDWGRARSPSTSACSSCSRARSACGCDSRPASTTPGATPTHWPTTRRSPPRRPTTRSGGSRHAGSASSTRRSGPSAPTRTSRPRRGPSGCAAAARRSSRSSGTGAPPSSRRRRASRASRSPRGRARCAACVVSTRRARSPSRPSGSTLAGDEQGRLHGLRRRPRRRRRRRRGGATRRRDRARAPARPVRPQGGRPRVPRPVEAHRRREPAPEGGLLLRRRGGVARPGLSRLASRRAAGA